MKYIFCGVGILPTLNLGRAREPLPTRKNWIFFNLEVPTFRTQRYIAVSLALNNCGKLFCLLHFLSRAIRKYIQYTLA